MLSATNSHQEHEEAKHNSAITVGTFPLILPSDSIRLRAYQIFSFPKVTFTLVYPVEVMNRRPIHFEQGIYDIECEYLPVGRALRGKAEIVPLAQLRGMNLSNVLGLKYLGPLLDWFKTPGFWDEALPGSGFRKAHFSEDDKFLVIEFEVVK